MDYVEIGNARLGKDHPTYIIAELSGNHGGKIDKAIEMIKAAHNAGADAIKLQVYKPDTITLNSDKEDFLIAKDNAWAEYYNLYNLYQYAHTPWEWLPTLFEEASKLNIELFGSVFDETSVDELEKYPVKAYKIASPEITDTALLKKVAQTGKPVILSTGLGDLEDISYAVNCLRSNGCADIILLKCTTAYPTPENEVNLKTIPNLQETFQCPAGLSDHTLGIGVAIAAVALGANLIEKHIKLNDEETAVDSFFSLTIKEFSQMISEIRRTELAIGDVNYSITNSALLNKSGRRSLYICAPIMKGEIITEQNIKSVRPGFGLEPKYKDIVLGRTVNCNLENGDRLSWSVIE
jgi:pseudaminic acid synthase